MTLEEVIAEVRAERERQDKRWGGVEHDQEHSVTDWVSLLSERLGKVSEIIMASHEYKPGSTRMRVVQLVAVAVAWLETDNLTSPQWECGCREAMCPHGNPSEYYR